jgi:hypothetical protein
MITLRTERMADQAKPSNVFSLHANTNYRPDMRALACEQFAAARARLNQSPEEFAETLAEYLDWAPGPGAIRSWESTVAPPGDVLLAANLVSHGNVDHTIPTAHAVAGDPDIRAAYATRRHIARPEWQDIIAGRTEHIWLYGMAEQGYANDDDVPAILEQATAQGCDIRILLLDPDYSAITEIDADEGNPPGTLAARIRGSLFRFDRMAKRCGGRMQVRTYRTPPTVSIVRGDSHMLFTPYLRSLTGGDSPTYRLEATPGGQIFSRHARHFNQQWADAEERAAA